MAKHWVMDLETLANCFTGVFIDYKTDERKIFIVHELKDDFEDFIKFLRSNYKNSERHISFNGIGFDAQVIQHILINLKEFNDISAEDKARKIYGYAQRTIEKSSAREFPDFWENDFHIKQLDVFKLNHWDNMAKRSSLKWIQYSMDWYNMQDMPIHHSTEIKTQSELDEIVEYCINDVLSTKNIFLLNKKEIQLRQNLTKQYGINLYSASEPKISKELFLEFLSKKLDTNKWELKKLRTFRKRIDVKDIILDYTEFKTEPFKKILENFKKLVINPLETKGAFKESVFYKGVKTDFGFGGLHGARESGVYEESEGMIIVSSDVKSYYPNLAIRNNWSPGHLPQKEFCELYEWFYDERIKIPKSDPRNYVYKIILNSTYGLTNDKYSPFYDPLMTMKITINGQLSLSMLYEMISEAIPGCIPLMQNTDGLETIIPIEYKEKYFEICEEWEKLTQLVLEHDYYQKLIISDVNNYIGIFPYEEISKEKKEEIEKNELYPLLKEEEGKHYYAPTKCKGRFEFQNLPLHKNKSHLVVRKAIYNYLVHNILPETYLAQNNSIFDYCAGAKVRNPWEFYEHWIEKGDYKKEKVQKVVRYYISNAGSKIIKHNPNDNRDIQLESGPWSQTVFNWHVKKEFKSYNVNQTYYRKRIYKEINNIIDTFKPKQMDLFTNN